MGPGAQPCSPAGPGQLEETAPWMRLMDSSPAAPLQSSPGLSLCGLRFPERGLWDVVAEAALGA